MKSVYALLAFFFGVLLASFLYFNGSVESVDEKENIIDTFIKNTESLPRYMEAGYSPLGRSPVVDALLNDPFYTPTYVESLNTLIETNSDQNQLYTLSSALFMAAGIPQDSLTPLIPPSDIPEKFLAAFKSSLTGERAYHYWTQFLVIREEVTAILSVLSEAEKEWIKQNYTRFFFGESKDPEEYEFFTSDNPYPLKFFQLAAKVDLAKLGDAARKLSLIADDFYAQRIHFEDALNQDFLVWEEKGSLLYITKKSGDTLTENADFFIDLGGSNTVINNAGGTEGTRPLALHLDLKGNNIYKGKNFVQGTGFLGVGLLSSCAGHNQFEADSYSQGCGFFGVGLMHSCMGENQYKLNFAGQAFGLFGFALLWDKEGKNHYTAVQGMAQAASSTLGVAFMINNKGGNTCLSGATGQGGKKSGGIGQGGSSGVRYYPWLNNPSFYGGLSFFYMGDGQNKLKTVWLGQGSAYFLGAGLLFSEGSDNTFQADYDAQGQGLHLGVGYLFSKGNHNYFNGGWGSMGVSGDSSVGMFISEGNKNHFQGTDQSIGSSRKPRSIGVFLGSGDDNSYLFQKLSNARILLPHAPNAWSRAFFLNIGKGSKFSENVDEFTRGNNKTWGFRPHSSGLSTEFVVDNPLEKIFAKFPSASQLPFDPVNGWADNRAYRPLILSEEEIKKLIPEIPRLPYDERRQVYESIDLKRFSNRKVDFDLSVLIKNPVNTPEDAFNYGILWALRNQDKADLNPIKTALAAHTIKSEYSRKMAVSLVGTYWKPDDTPLLNTIMLHDPSDKIRYFAALALAFNLPNDKQHILKIGSESDSELVKYAIAKGLQESTNPEALAIVQPLLFDDSFYVQRAAGITALSLGDKEGITVVLSTLKIDTLDTDDNYGQNIYKQLAAYTDVDFGVDKAKWIKWWGEVKESYVLPKR